MILVNKKNLFLQISFLFLLTSLLFYLKGEGLSFLLGALFSYFYMGVFFYSLQALFFKQKKSWVLSFFLVKWFLLLGVLIFVLNYLSILSFLIGLGMIPALIASYLLDYTQKQKI